MSAGSRDPLTLLPLHTQPAQVAPAGYCLYFPQPDPALRQGIAPSGSSAVPSIAQDIRAQPDTKAGCSWHNGASAPERGGSFCSSPGHFWSGLMRMQHSQAGVFVVTAQIPSRPLKKSTLQEMGM